MVEQTKVPYRSIVRAPPGKSLISLDLSAAESWIVAHLSQDQNMLQELSSGDLHSFTACIIFEIPVPSGSGKARFKGIIDEAQRYMGKKTNHGSGYRMSAFKMTDEINKDGQITVSLYQVKRYAALWHNTFAIKSWWFDIEEKLNNNNRTLTTTYGRSREFFSLWSDDLLKEATAYEPQSTVADHMRGRIHPELGIKGGIREIYYLYKDFPEIKLLQTAHDSLLLEAPSDSCEEIALQCQSLLLRPLVVRGETFKIPVDCDIYPERWGENKRKLPTAS